jgi:hypothetical protein
METNSRNPWQLKKMTAMACVRSHHPDDGDYGKAGLTICIRDCRPSHLKQAVVWIWKLDTASGPPIALSVALTLEVQKARGPSNFPTASPPLSL